MNLDTLSFYCFHCCYRLLMRLLLFADKCVISHVYASLGFHTHTLIYVIMICRWTSTPDNYSDGEWWRAFKNNKCTKSPICSAFKSIFTFRSELVFFVHSKLSGSLPVNSQQPDVTFRLAILTVCCVQWNFIFCLFWNKLYAGNWHHSTILPTVLTVWKWIHLRKLGETVLKSRLFSLCFVSVARSL